MIDNVLLTELKSCKKLVQKLKPNKEKTQYNHKQQTILIDSDNRKYSFEIFTRQNLDLPNDFSVWLLWKWPERAILLCRYNWDHGGHRNKLENEMIGWYHMHQYNKKYKDAWLNDDAYAEATNIYKTFPQALFTLFKDYHIENYSDYFPELPSEKSLFTF